MNGGMPGPYYNTAMPDAYPPYESTPPPVYSETSPTPYSTDQPALIPDQTSYQEPTWFDINAPYQEPDPFADWPAPLQQQPEPNLQAPQPITTPSGAPYLSDEQLPPELKPWWDVPLEAPSMADVGFAPDVKTSSLTGFEDKFGGYNEQPTVYGESYEVNKQPLSIGPAGPIEFVGEIITNVTDFAGDVVDTIFEIGKFIIEHLQLDMRWTGGGFQASSGLLGIQYSTTPAKPGISPDDYAEYSKLTAQGQVTSGSEQQPAQQMPGQFSTNMYILAGGLIIIALMNRR